MALPFLIKSIDTVVLPEPAGPIINIPLLLKERELPCMIWNFGLKQKRNNKVDLKEDNFVSMQAFSLKTKYASLFFFEKTIYKYSESSLEWIDFGIICLNK